MAINSTMSILGNSFTVSVSYKLCMLCLNIVNYSFVNMGCSSVLRRSKTKGKPAQQKSQQQI